MLGEVKQSISNLLEMYASPASHPEYQFLSQLDLMDYYHVEEQYTHGLADYTRKQFFEVLLYSTLSIPECLNLMKCIILTTGCN